MCDVAAEVVDRPSTTAAAAAAAGKQLRPLPSSKQYTRGLQWKTDRQLNQQQQPATTKAKTSSWRATAGFQ